MQYRQRIVAFILATQCLIFCNKNSTVETPSEPAETPTTPTTPGEQPGEETTDDLLAAQRLINVFVDTNRNGVLDASDDANEETSNGAIFIANIDDDNADKAFDANNETIDGNDDVADLTPIIIKRLRGLKVSDDVTLTASPNTAALRIRVFMIGENNTYSVLLSPNKSTGTIPGSLIKNSDVTLYIEAIETRNSNWNGTVTLTATVKNNNQLVSSDVVALRIAPIIFPSDTQAAKHFYVMRIADPRSEPNLPFYNDIEEHLSDSIVLHPIDEDTYYADRWVQDNMQIGYQEWPSASGRQVMTTYLQAQRPTDGYGLESLVPEQLFSKNYGYVYPGGLDTSHNYGGNLEVIPPHQGYPFGRMISGGGSQGTLLGSRNTDRMNAAQRNFLNAQEIQGPLLEVSSEWLVVGHIDEIFLFLPDKNNRNGKNWKVVLAAPHLALQALQQLADQNRGSLKIFAGRSTETTVNEILNDDNLLAFNAAAQTRIDGIRQKLKQNIPGLTDADFLEVPVLYETLWYGGIDLAAAYDPGIQNLVTANETLFIPDPEGPTVNGQDVWQQQTLASLAGLSLNIRFNDVFNSYHLLLGESHCGTNIEREPYGKAFWQGVQQ